LHAYSHDAVAVLFGTDADPPALGVNFHRRSFKRFQMTCCSRAGSPSTW
jgi:hypothetical protein